MLLCGACSLHELIHMTGYANARIHAETRWDEVDQPWGNLAELIPNASEHVDLAATHDYSLVRHQPRLQTIDIYCLWTKLHEHAALRACHRDSRAFLHCNRAASTSSISCRTLRVAGLQQQAQFCIAWQRAECSFLQPRQITRQQQWFVCHGQTAVPFGTAV